MDLAQAVPSRNGSIHSNLDVEPDLDLDALQALLDQPNC
jgi:hypothetical protein